MALVSDDVLCSYDDVSNHDPFAGKRSDPLSMGFLETRVGRPLVRVYGHPDEYPREEISTIVEKCMKKFVDNLLWHLDGISERMSQLEILCNKLRRAIGEFRADTLRDQNVVETNLKSLEKNLQEVHRSLQILRDKQELAETHKELTKLQLAPKESNTSTPSQKSEEGNARSHDNTPEIPNPHSALALPPPERYIVCQPIPLYTQQSQASQPELHYIQVQPRNQFQDASIRSPLPPQQIQVVNQAQHPQPFPQNPQQFTQQMVDSTHQLPPQTIILRPQAPPPYALYTHQPINQESFTYGGSDCAVNLPNQSQQQARSQSYVSAAPYPPQSNIQSYSTVYSIDGSRVQSTQTYQHPSNPKTQQIIHPNANPNPNRMQSHPHGEVIEKAVSMGYPREQAIGVVNRMAESGQPVDFNALLDGMSSRPQAWSG